MEQTERGTGSEFGQGFISKLAGSTASSTATASRLTFRKKLIGGLLGRRVTHIDFRESKSYKHAIISYALFFVVNVALMFLFTYLLSPGTYSAFASDLVWYLPMFVLIHLALWLLRVLIYHILCKLAGGTATIGTAFSASAFVYPINSVLMLTMCLLALVINLQQYLLVFVPFLLVLLLLVWRAIIIIRYTSTIHRITLRRAFVVFLIQAAIFAALLLGLYTGITMYLDSLRDRLLLMGAGV